MKPLIHIFISFIFIICFSNLSFGKTREINSTGQQIAKFVNNKMVILKQSTASGTPQWALAMDNVPIKLGDDVVYRNIEVRKIGDEVGLWVEDLLGTLIDNSITIITKNENLPNWIKESFKDSKYVTAQTSNKVTLYRDFGDQAFMDGSFSTTTNNATRNELALHPSFNNSMRFKSTIEVPTGEILNVGKVGPYPPGSSNALPGGADQILLPENYNHDWIKQIVDTQTGQIYTVNQFKSLFPNLIKNP